MPEIVFKDFSAGWQPCVDPISGPKTALIQMDNLELDSTGALTLQGGTEVTHDFSSINPDYAAHTMFSRLINGTTHDYEADSNGGVWRDTTLIGSGGDSLNAGFGTAFNFTLIASGNTRLKDSGSGTPVNLGILPPSVAPTVTGSSTDNKPKVEIGSVILSSNIILGVSSRYNDANSQSMNSVHGYSVVLQTYGLSGVGPFNCADFGTGGVQTQDDYVTVSGILQYPVSDSTTARPLTLDILLVPGDNIGSVVSDYYSYTILNLFDIGDTPKVQDTIATINFTVNVPRRSFIRVGNGHQTWETVYGFRFTYSSPVSAGADLLTLNGATATGGLLYFFGGFNTQTGDYQYAQLNVNNTGSYIAKSVLGPVSGVITSVFGQPLVTPQDPRTVDPQCNEAWIYRKGGNLDKWYRVMVFTNATGYTTPTADVMSDQDALTLNLTINLNLISINSVSVTDKIYDILGPINGRWYYFTEQFIYPSDINDPDLVDASLAVRTCGNSSELFMWARVVNKTAVLVGTSIDIYTLSGTFATLSDGTVDITYLGTGTNYPPITCDAATYGGTLYYLANDGWRVFR